MLTLLRIGIAAQEFYNRPVISADIGNERLNAILAGFFDNEIQKLRANAFLLEIIANRDGGFRRCFSCSYVAGSGNGRARTSRQIRKSQEAFALCVSSFC